MLPNNDEMTTNCEGILLIREPQHILHYCKIHDDHI